MTSPTPAPEPGTTPALPKAAADLVALAHANGWRAAVAHYVDNSGNPFVNVELARGTEADPGTWPLWYFSLCWHTRPTGGKTYRLFSKIDRHASVDGRGHYWQDTKSLIVVRETITGNPVTPTTTPEENGS